MFAPENPRADSGESLLRHLVVDTGLTIFQTMHLAPDARVKKPLHQLWAVDAERILQILVRSGAVAVERDGEALNAEF
jgi:hypothetical protein